MAASLLPCFRIPLFLWHRLSCWFLYQSIAVQSSLCRQWQWHPTGCNSSPRRNTCLWEAWHCGISEEWWYAHRLSAPISSLNGTEQPRPTFPEVAASFPFSRIPPYSVSPSHALPVAPSRPNISLPPLPGSDIRCIFFPHSLSHDSISLRCPSRWCFRNVPLNLS